VIADMLGLAQADHPWFHRWYGSITAFLGNPRRAPEVTAAGLAMREEFSAFMLPLIRRRREEPGDDLLSMLCEAEVGGTRMSDEDIKAFCSLLLTVGGETTGKAIGSLFANLLRHPDQLEAVRRDRGLIAPAFAETLRYSPPIHMIMRQPARDVAFSHGIVPAGSTITCLIGAANRDPARYADPDSFDIFRDDLPTDTAFSSAARHLAFATGRHFCVGALLAKAEVEIGTDQLLDAMPGMRMANGFQPAEQGTFTRGPRALPVRFTPAR
jgi:cytochrome P450